MHARDKMDFYPNIIIGDRVQKISGYPFPGEVRSIFTTKSGLLRYAVEATGEDYRGMLHIFSPEQIKAHTDVPVDPPSARLPILPALAISLMLAAGALGLFIGWPS